MMQSIARLASRALIRLEGPSWRDFLQGLITQDVACAADGGLAYGALLTPQGRLLYDFFFWEQAGGAVLDVAASAREELIRKLQGYRLRAKLEIEPTRGSVFAAWGVGPPLGEPWRADPRLADLGWRLAPPEGLAPREELLVTEADYEVHRLALGVPDPAKDGKEADYPIELNMDLLGGIDFKKGCFVGQETTSRMHRRGGVKSRMAPWPSRPRPALWRRDPCG